MEWKDSLFQPWSYSASCLQLPTTLHFFRHGKRAKGTCGHTPRPGKDSICVVVFNKVKGSMYFTALWAARLIRAGVGHGVCVGYSEVEV